MHQKARKVSFLFPMPLSYGTNLNFYLNKGLESYQKEPALEPELFEDWEPELNGNLNLN